MNRGLYIATTGLLNNSKQMDAISNNLANINTNSYKREMVISESFPEKLLSRINDNPSEFQKNKPYSGLKFEKKEGYYQAEINQINSAFFRIQTPAGMSYNSRVNFRVDDNGYLRTDYGNYKKQMKSDGENFIVDKTGQKIKIEIKEGQNPEDINIQIDNTGNLLVDGQKQTNLLNFPAWHVIGTTSAGIRSDRTVIDFSQGDVLETGNNLDFALKGDGFFKVKLGEKEFYTRDGSFSLNPNGEIITSEGALVLGQYGSIRVQNEDFKVNSDTGNIIVNGEIVDKFDIVKIDNTEDLRKKGDNLYEGLENIEIKEVPYKGSIMRYALEQPNVNNIDMMVSMINVMRNYETNQKVIRMIDENLGKAISDLPRV
jgi:flagellar basal-body rod protein FlgG